MSDLFDRIASLPLEKRRALEALLERTGIAPAKSTIPRRDPNTPVPLSFAQQRLWFLDQLAADLSRSLYTVSSTWLLTGPLDRIALEQALNAIVARHEALRTSFPLLDGQPIQAIRPVLKLELPAIDLRAVAEGERAAEAQRRLAETIERPFDLARGPLIRAALLRLAEAEYCLAVSMHHTVADGWSVGILTRELAAFYAAYAAGTPAGLPELPIQYADFAAWQRQWLHGADDHAGSPLQEQLAYWRQQLAGAPPALALPTDHPRPAVQTFQGATHTIVLPYALGERLKALSQRESCTLFMTLLAAFAALLYRYTGQSDLTVGTPIAGRTRVETEALIGLFVNTLVLPADLSGNPRFGELLQRVRTVCLGAYAHQDLPFEKLVEVLQPQRDLSHNPLFQVLFALHNAPRPTVALPGLDMQPVGGKNTVARFDLSLDIRELPGGLTCALEYNTDIFEAATIARMAGHFKTLLEGVVADSGQHIAVLPLLTEPERLQLLVQWNAAPGVRSQESGVRRNYPVSDLLASDPWLLTSQFEAQAARTPDAVAVVFDEATNDQRPTTNDIQDKETRRQGDKQIQERSTDKGSVFSVQPPRGYPAFSVQCLTYSALNRRANQLAWHLRALGVGPEVRVGICVARSLELLVGLLGTLKAGGAYVPLDPAYPPQRLRFMLEDAQVRVVLTAATRDERRMTNDESSASSFVLRPSSFVNIQVVDLNKDWEGIARQPETNPDSGATADQLAYVIYTSGSTGTPKGVQVQHRSVINLLAATRPVFEFGTGDVWTVVHSYAFDFSVWELWGCLLHGSRLVIVPLEVTQAPAMFYDLLCREQVTILNQTPSAIRPLVEARQAAVDGPRLALRVVMCGGEAFPRDLAAPVLAWGFPLWNFYGPTEATVWAAINPIGAVAAGYDVVPIGQPLANTQLHILDAYLQLVPVGVPGELHIGGAQLARGYLSRPDLTAERFIPNPFARVSGVGSRVSEEAAPNTRHLARGTRLYKTGDLARRLPSGEIEFLGRIDQQVKLRGFRIELGEIEAVLGQHAAVREAVVVAREDAPGDRRLVAYIVPAETLNDERRTMNEPERSSSSFIVHPSSLVSGLRDYLKQKLPEYMIPAAFVLLDALPLSSNGKVDRRALPLPDGQRPELIEEYLPPRTALERTIAAIWQEVLRVERVGVNDNFFDLGGHSLLMVQVQSKLREALQREISLLEMFRHPSVGTLAAYFSSGEAEGGALRQSQVRTAARHESRERQQQTLQSRRQARRAASLQKGEQDD